MNKNTEGEYKLQCEICNSNYFSDKKYKCVNNLLQHLKLKHQLTKTMYLKTYKIPEDFLKEFNERACSFSKEKYRDPNFAKIQNEKTLQAMGEDEFKKLPTCEICGLKSKQLYSHIAKIHGIKVEDYRKKYKENLEEEKYLKYLSETRLGENNPMWGCGQSENSPFSPQFYIKKGYDEESAKKLASDLSIKVKNEMPPEKWSVKIEYYKKKYNIGDIEAYDMLYKRQQTNAVKNIAERHNISIVKAQDIRNNITEKWVKTMNSKSIEEINEINRKKLSGLAPTSNVANNFFKVLIEECNLSKENVLTKDDELILRKVTDGGIIKNYRYDFTYKNKIIEYNGDLFHANPSKYKTKDIPLTWLAMKKNSVYMKTAEEIWNHDKSKMQLAEDNNYEVLVIWHSEIKKNKYRILQKCKEFLLS